MASLNGRLERLEGRSARSSFAGNPTPRYLDAYFKELENLERKEAGLEPLPYTEEDREWDEAFLRETLPAYRTGPGWQTEEAQHVLDTWERGVTEKLYGKDHT